ncbi:putative flagellar hook length determination protein [Bradyrhizobium sp. ORS 278]|uniref:flagellar hook-length control protein FliK n=1 Tax=Bradyrhizobium sp. (strain ORS 278) TaxID=114615 RepID=UPI0001508BEB|nr:flagellar hook-length control protein FliK [Bradyrhizobium sp. ORS 278]CAL79559.1 putative flagellar hook length determination protein [Bradyrhizobium sp. ORS 278]
MFSVTSDIQASPALKTTAPKQPRQDASQLPDSFSALVDAATPPDPSTSSLPSPQPVSRASSAAPSRDSGRSSDTDRTSQAKASDKTQGQADNGPSRTDKAGPDTTSDTTAGKPAKSATDSTDSTDGKTTEKTTDKTDGDKASADAIAAAQAATADQATGPTPVAVALPSGITLATAAVGPGATDGDGTSAGPTPTGPAGTAAPVLDGSVDANAGLMAAAAKTAGAKTAGDAASTTGADAATTARTETAAPSDQTFTAALDAATPGGSKPAVKAAAQAKTGLAAGETGKSADLGNAPAQGAHPQNQAAGPTQQPAVATKPDGSELEPAKGNTTPAPSAHERGAAPGNVQTNGQIDPSAQAATALQPQLSTPAAQTNPITAANLTATAATTASVPLHGLAVEIAASALNGKSRFEIRLDPAELGRIDVRIDVDRNGQVTSHLRVEKPETLAMLQQTAPQLQQALQDAGLKSNNSGLQFSLRDQNSSGQNGGDYQQNGNSQRLIVTEDENVPVQLAGRSYGRMFGAQGGVDIRV